MLLSLSDNTNVHRDGPSSESAAMYPAKNMHKFLSRLRYQVTIILWLLATTVPSGSIEWFLKKMLYNHGVEELLFYDKTKIDDMEVAARPPIQHFITTFTLHRRRANIGTSIRGYSPGGHYSSRYLQVAF
jgi:hypothetical protein